MAFKFEGKEMYPSLFS